MTKSMFLISMFLLSSCGANDRCYRSCALDLQLEDKIQSRGGWDALTRKDQIAWSILQEFRARSGGEDADDLRIELAAKEEVYRSREDLLENSIVYHPDETVEVQKVRRKFGALRVDVTPGNEWQTLTAPQPWAGYWYPLRGNELFEGRNSPMGKFDRLLGLKGRPQGAANWERELRDTISADGWEGLCDAWAAASVNLPDPTASRFMNGIEFTTTDQRALLTKLFQRVDRQRFGIRYRGNADTDGTYQDLRPEALFVALRTRIGNGKTLLMDDDAGIQVWSKPVYQIKFRSSWDTEVSDAIRLELLVDMVGERDEVDPRPTAIDDVIRVRYTARLHVNRSSLNNVGYKVLAGEWIEDSRDEHPDYIELVENIRDYQSANPFLNENLDLAKAIAGLE